MGHIQLAVAGDQQVVIGEGLHHFLNAGALVLSRQQLTERRPAPGVFRVLPRLRQPQHNAADDLLLLGRKGNKNGIRPIGQRALNAADLAVLFQTQDAVLTPGLPQLLQRVLHQRQGAGLVRDIF